MSDRSLHAHNARPWQSIEQLTGETQQTGEFTDPSITDGQVSRRGFLTALSATMALTAAACRRPLQHLVPSVASNQTAIPGLPVDYATVYQHGNVAYGALVKTREGRPIKVKGNNLHPANAGRANSVMQASLLSLYDPDRLRRPRVRRGGGATTADNAIEAIANAVRDAQAAGKKAVVMTGDHCSPTFTVLQQEITKAVPAIQFVSAPDALCDNAAQANNALLGVNAELVPDLSRASVIVSVDADILGTDPLSLYHTTTFTHLRKPTQKNAAMNKLIVAEAQYSLTGANADKRYRLHPSQLEAFLAVLESEICGSSAIGASEAAKADTATRAAAQQSAASLRSAQQQGVVLVGRHLSPRAHAMTLHIASTLGSLGSGQVLDPSRRLPNSGVRSDAIATLQAELEAGNVHALLFCGVNPEYSGNRSLRKAILNAPFRAAINLYEDETAALCDVSIPASHWLESWGDALAFDGTLSVQQPMIRPLNDGVESTCDTLMALARKLSNGFLAETETYHDLVKATWKTQLGADASEAAWNTALRDGVTTRISVVAPTVFNSAGAQMLAGNTTTNAMSLLVVPSLTMGDGAWGNNAWLMELPDPVTKITWDNVALISAATAEKLGLGSVDTPKAIRRVNGTVVTISTADGTIDAPVWVQPGMADNVVALALGFGHTSIGTIGNGVGVNAYTVNPSGQRQGYITVTSVTPAGTSMRIACSQDHHSLDDGRGERPVAKQITLAALASGKLENMDQEYPSTGTDGRFAKPLSIVPEYTYKGHRWGMVIDMSACTGCSSCIIACQSENNISVVGKEQVLIGREMHWIRLDRYYVGDVADPETLMEPMLCQHCENAPCENVCPVAATTHSPEGLNEMTYNRCVGTRYCLNNCPYKVRRFNFLDYNDNLKSPTDLVFNPDITMRMRGVMEKCTFCVQRLHEAKWHARDAGRARVNDGEAVTACQEACPAGAIIFGDVNDPNSAVSQARKSERGFQVLAELNVRPQVTYLAKVRNV